MKFKRKLRWLMLVLMSLFLLAGCGDLEPDMQDTRTVILNMDFHGKSSSRSSSSFQSSHHDLSQYNTHLILALPSEKVLTSSYSDYDSIDAQGLMNTADNTVSLEIPLKKTMKIFAFLFKETTLTGDEKAGYFGESGSFSIGTNTNSLSLGVTLIQVPGTGTDTGGETGTTDTTAPTVTSVSTTANNQSSVSITDNITVIFSEAMDTTYITTSTSDAYCAGTIRVSSNNFTSCVKMSSEPVSSNSNKTFTLDPYDNLTFSTTYKTRVTTGVKDTAGNTLSSQYTTATGFATFISFTAHTISTSADGARDVYAIDLDSDGDIDVLSASENDDKIAWYENNGSESFTAHTITTFSDGTNPQSVYAVDIDGDGDIDVLSGSEGTVAVAWYENNGSQSFIAHTIATNSTASHTRSVHAADVDSDGDMDVLSASVYDNKVNWYENNGSQSFTARTITTTGSQARDVYAVDLDRDGDIDVISASWNDNKVSWSENNGSESFTTHTITSSALGVYNVYVADVDSDGDLDVLSSSGTDGKTVWYENNGSESFTGHTIDTNGAWSTYVVDLDSDGDMDVASVSGGDPIYWYENNGSQSFTSNTIISNAGVTRSVHSIDVDGDGDMDVLSASENNDKIVWYENSLIH